MTGAGSPRTRPPRALAPLLLLATLTVYAPVARFAFLNFDDPLYVTDNPVVRDGLTAAGVRWAFTTTQAAYWHPLTWLSHMLDCQLFGLEAGAHHGVNVLLHAANALLLLALLARMTGAPLRSAWVAALFALHPLHVESVAWVAERKDVLSTLCWMLAVWAYLRAVERPTGARRLAVVLLFAAGLMAKQMIVTLPLVLLLLDWWPLGRLSITPASLRGRVREKLPLIALSALAAVVIFVAQREGGAMVTLEAVPPGTRLVNALVSYWRYVLATLWPVRLAIVYPYVFLPAWQGVVAGLGLVVATAAVLRAARSAPYLAVGWLWYVVMLVPVIGVVQVGVQSWADRFSYLPIVGLFIMVAWGVPELTARWRVPAQVVTAAAGGVLVVCAGLSAVQVRHWRDSETVFHHALAVTEANDVAHGNLGEALARQGRFVEAASHHAEAARLNQRSPESRTNLGNAALREGRWADAEREFRFALRLRPGFAAAENGLGVALANAGDGPGAIAHYREALRLRPDYVEPRVNLGNAFVRAGRPEEALAEYDEALRLRPGWPEAHLRRGEVLARLGRTANAAAAFRAALAMRPGWTPAESALAALGANPEPDPRGRPQLP